MKRLYKKGELRKTNLFQNINDETGSQLKEFNYKIKLLLKRYSPALIPYSKGSFIPLDSFMIKEGDPRELYILMKYITGEP